jgi:MarR family transcriptional regulator, 2-MHQ and catechol-resistance regulon repressor
MLTEDIFRHTTPDEDDSHQMTAVASVQVDNTLVTLLAARRRRVTKQVAAGGLAPTEEGVLRFLLERGATNVTKLASLMGVKKPTATVTVRRMCRYGLVTRDCDPSDNRAVIVEPTLKGKQAYYSLMAERHATLISRLNRITAEERQQLKNALPVLERITAELLARRSSLNPTEDTEDPPAAISPSLF